MASAKKSQIRIDARDPRSFPYATGFLLQVVGGVFFFGGCCVWSFSGLIQAPVDFASASGASWGVREWLTQSPPGQVIAAINTVVTAMGGLALMVFGVGLQNERPRAARGAVVTAGALAISWVSMTIASIVWAPAILRILLNVLFAAVSIGVFMMALGARRELRLHPPVAEPDEPVTPEFLAEFDLQRRLERELASGDEHDREESERDRPD